MKDQAVDLLKEAGLSGYEAKAYVALLGAGEPVNGYEVAKTSGVPRSTVYETLSKLVARGAAFEVATDGDSVAYVALPSESLIGRLRRQTDETIAGLEESLPQVGRALTSRVVQSLGGPADVTTRTLDVIESARQTIWLSIWAEEGSRFVSALEAAAQRGVAVFTISHGEIEGLPGLVYPKLYSSPEAVHERTRCRVSLTIADHQQATISGVTDEAVWGIWTDDHAVALLAAEHVRHDIALQVAARRLEEAGLFDFWTDSPDLETLRDASASVMGSAPFDGRPPESGG